MPYLYFGERAGARILRYGTGFSQVGDAYQMDVETHARFPAGEFGDMVGRTVDVLVRHTLGYEVDVTPIVDAVVGTAQRFSGGPPSGGSLDETKQLQGYVGKRGNRLAVRVRTTTLSGEIELLDVQMSTATIRTTP